jgi:hypothetical protein
VFAHRLLVTADAHVAGRTAEDLLDRIRQHVGIPSPTPNTWR